MSEFPADWENGCIGDIAKVVSGYAFQGDDFHDNHQEGVPVVRMSDIQDQGLNLGSAKRISNINQEVLRKFQIRQGDLLFGMSGSIEKSAIVNSNQQALLNQRVGALRSIKENGNFHAHIFQSERVKSQILDLAAGGAQLNISAKQVESIRIAIPPLPEQKKIAEILSGIDFLLKALNDLIAKQVSLKKAMTWDLMSHGAGSRDLKDSDQGKIPFDWEVRSLGSVFTLTSGKSKPKSLLSSIATGSEKIPVYGGNGITGYASEYLLDLPTITIGRVGEYCGAVHLTPNMCWVTDNALYIKDRISDFDLPFMYYFLVFCEISKMRKKGGQPLISQKPILDLVVALPPIEEQRRIALTLNSISKNISIMEVRRQRIKEFRDSVSQDLLSGRKRVSI